MGWGGWVRVGWGGWVGVGLVGVGWGGWVGVGGLGWVGWGGWVGVGWVFSRLGTQGTQTVGVAHIAMGHNPNRTASEHPIQSPLQYFPRMSSPFCFFAFLGSLLFSTNQAKYIYFCWGPSSRQE